MSGAARPVLAVFDLCDTLYAENTTRGFVRYVHARCGRRSTARLLDWLHSRRLPLYYLAAVAERVTRRDLLRQVQLRSLNGFDRATLAEAGRAYAAEVLPALAVAETQRRLAAHREAGDRVVIVSNSLDVVVEAVAGELGVEWRASRLAWRDGRCTGEIAQDLTGRKSAIVAELTADARVPPELHVYTDNPSDRDLVERADHPTIVIPAGRRRKRWAGADAVYLEL